MIKCLLTDLGRAGLENIWPLVMAHRPRCARSVRHDLGPNIFPSGPPTQSIRTYSYGWCLLIEGYFCAAQSYAEKAELSKCSWYPKRKLGVTTHFSEIIKLQFGEERFTLLCILTL